MNLVIEKKTFVEIEKINSIKNHVDKLVSKSIDKGNASGKIEINLSYSDNNFDDCFKVLSFDYSLLLDEINIIDVALGNVYIFIVEGQGVNIEYSLNVLYDSKKAVEIIDSPLEKPSVEEEITNDEALKEENPNIENEKIKDEIKESYEEKLDEELDDRNSVKIISTKDKRNELNFLDFFNQNIANRFRIKTLECSSRAELKEISNTYNIKIEELEKGFDIKSKTVTFKLNE